jgi:hypothetical protein
MIKDLIKSYRLFYNWEGAKLYFIVSTGRTGTNFLANFFAENFSNVYSVHEPYPDLFNIGMGKFRGQNGLFTTQKKIKIARYKQHKKLNKKENEIYLESNPNLAFILPELRQIFPHAKVIYVTRDIKTYLVSAYNKSPDNSNENFFYGENDHRNRITPDDLGDIHYSKVWDNWDRFQRIAWFWTKCNEKIIRDLHQTDYLKVKFEDLFQGDKSVNKFKEVINYLGLNSYFKKSLTDKMLATKRNKNSKKLITSYSDIPENIQREIKKISQEIRYKLEY